MTRITLLIVGVSLCFIVAFWRITSSNVEHYFSVQSYIKENSESYYDFYDIDSYLYNKTKQKLSEMNSLKVFYNVDPKDNYNITIKKNDFEITYRMDTIPYTKEETKNKDIIDNQYRLYLEREDHFMSIEYYIDDDTCLGIRIREISDSCNQTSLQQALINLMKDSISLNLKKEEM